MKNVAHKPNSLVQLIGLDLAPKWSQPRAPSSNPTDNYLSVAAPPSATMSVQQKIPRGAVVAHPNMGTGVVLGSVSVMRSTDQRPGAQVEVKLFAPPHLTVIVHEDDLREIREQP